MPYNLQLTDGTILIAGGLPDNTVNTSSTSLALIGRNYAGYGTFINENFVKLLENFSNTNSPASPIEGQIWWDSTNEILKVYDGTVWKIPPAATSSTTAPTSVSTGGDLWWNNSNNQLSVWTGSEWYVIGEVLNNSITTSQLQNYSVTSIKLANAAVGTSQLSVGSVTGNILHEDIALPGLPTAATVSPGDNTESLATTAYITNATAGLLEIDISDATILTLLPAQYGTAILKFVGAIINNVIIIVPNAGWWQMENATTGLYTVTIKTLDGSGFVLPQANSIYTAVSDGTNTSCPELSISTVSLSEADPAGAAVAMAIALG